MENIKHNKYYILVGFVGIILLISAGVILYKYNNQKQTGKENIIPSEKERIIEDLKTQGVPLTTEQKKEVVSDFKKGSTPLSDTQKLKILQDLQNLKK